MVRKMVLIAGITVFAMSGLVFAMDCGNGCSGNSGNKQLAQANAAKDGSAKAAASAAVNEPVDVGNTVCPVTGEQIDPLTKATYVYEGKIYNFCCPMCIPTFKKDPQKYIEKIEQGKAAASKAKPMDMQHHAH